jgi:hypothetical protein
MTILGEKEVDVGNEIEGVVNAGKAAIDRYISLRCGSAHLYL